jgi:hypothetical protein
VPADGGQRGVRIPESLVQTGDEYRCVRNRIATRRGGKRERVEPGDIAFRTRLHERDGQPGLQ